MTKKILLLAIILCFFCQNGKTQETIHVITHNRETVVTNPSVGEKSYRRWGVFPTANMPVRKIIMHVNFGCPDTMRCADWDYADRISIRRKGGVNGASQDYEIGRMLTPYGGAFGKDWHFEWALDVTDFSLLLRDSVEIDYNHTVTVRCTFKTVVILRFLQIFWVLPMKVGTSPAPFVTTNGQV